MNDMLTFEIDLNMLRGDRVRSHIDVMQGAVGRMRAPQSGETVWAVDEDGARYLATLEKVYESGFVDLLIKLETRIRVGVTLEPQPMPVSDRVQLAGATTAGPLVNVTNPLTTV